MTSFCRFIREFKDVCLQEGENGNKTFWNAVKSLGRGISLISKPEAQAAVRAHQLIGSNLGSQILLGQGGKSAVAEATAVKVDTTHRSLEMRLRSMPSSSEINRTLRLFSTLACVTYTVYFRCNCDFGQTHRLPHHPPSKLERPPCATVGAGAGSSGSGSSIFAFVG